MVSVKQWNCLETRIGLTPMNTHTGSPHLNTGHAHTQTCISIIARFTQNGYQGNVGSLVSFLCVCVCEFFCMFYSCGIDTSNHILMALATCTDSSLGAHKHTYTLRMSVIEYKLVLIDREREREGHKMDWDNYSLSKRRYVCSMYMHVCKPRQRLLDCT